MTTDQARDAATKAFIASWGTTTGLCLENEDEKKFDAGKDPWVRMTVKHLPGGQETLGQPGNRLYERKGIVYVQIFTPKNGGMQRGDVLAHQARAIFEGNSISGIDYNDGQVSEGKPDGKWMMHLAQVNFNYYETK